MFKQHIEDTAIQLAHKQYKMDIQYLSPTIQDKLYEQAGEIVERQLKESAEFWRNQKQE